MPEQDTSGYVADVLTLRSPTAGPPPAAAPTPAPAAALTVTAEPVRRRRQSRLTVRHVTGDDIVAVVEVVSLGNKDRRAAVADFAARAVGFLSHGVHLLVADLLPPRRHDPQGMHAAVWRRLTGRRFAPPPGKPLGLTAYRADRRPTAFIEPLAVGDRLPDMPLFLAPGLWVPVPLEATYQLTVRGFAARWRRVLEG